MEKKEKRRLPEDADIAFEAAVCAMPKTYCAEDVAEFAYMALGALRERLPQAFGSGEPRVLLKKGSERKDAWVFALPLSEWSSYAVLCVRFGRLGSIGLWLLAEDEDIGKDPSWLDAEAVAGLLPA